LSTHLVYILSWFTSSQRIRTITLFFLVALISPVKVWGQIGRVNGSIIDEPIILETEQITGRPDQILHLRNHIDITRGQINLKSNEATYHITENEVTAHGWVKLKRYGNIYTGENLRFNLDTGRGSLTKLGYWFKLNGSHGNAERIDFMNRKSKITCSTYTTCKSIKPDWYIESSTLDIDNDFGRGVARNNTLYFKGVPILFLPILSLSLSNNPESGALPPVVAATNRGGLELNLPYYFNIAPNIDLTLYPNVILTEVFS